MPHPSEPPLDDAAACDGVFNLTARHASKSEYSRIAADERRFAEIAAALTADRAALSARRESLRGLPAPHGEAALERDLEIHRLTSQLRATEKYGVDACLGRMVLADGAVRYIGRFGVASEAGEPLLIDWRTPAAEPFFAATLARPLGVLSRRRYRWHDGRIIDYWDEILAGDGRADGLSPDDQSSFIAGLGATRTSRMRDVLGTIQADQDAIIRAESRGALVVEGGPGTGKTVVALHRAAYLQYADPRVASGTGGVLVVGPHRPYLAYVEDVLPNLGEQQVQLCTPSDFVREGDGAGVEADVDVARLKASARLLDAVENATRAYEGPPTTTLAVESPWGDIDVTAAVWADAFTTTGLPTAHNDARDQVWDELLDILVDLNSDDDTDPSALRSWLARDDDLRRTFRRAWPILDPAFVVRDLLTVRSYLKSCAPWLDDSELDALQRSTIAAWTTSDVPLLDEARRRIGDPERISLQRRREAAHAAEQEVRRRVVDELVAADDSELRLMSILRGQDADNSLADDAVLPSREPDSLAGPFAHIIVDEAQELTDAQWRMLLARCPSRSFTIVGDRAQARDGFTESWQSRLARVGFTHITHSSLTINYRTPVEVMDAAAPVIHAVLPDANVPTSVRVSGVAVEHGALVDLVSVVSSWISDHPEGTAAVVDTRPAPTETDWANTLRDVEGRVRVLTPTLSKGLEFDLVIVLESAETGDDLTEAVDRYVAMTRATGTLVVLRESDAATDAVEAS